MRSDCFVVVKGYVRNKLPGCKRTFKYDVNSRGGGGGGGGGGRGGGFGDAGGGGGGGSEPCWLNATEFLTYHSEGCRSLLGNKRR